MPTRPGQRSPQVGRAPCGMRTQAPGRTLRHRAPTWAPPRPPGHPQLPPGKSCCFLASWAWGGPGSRRCLCPWAAQGRRAEASVSFCCWEGQARSAAHTARGDPPVQPAPQFPCCPSCPRDPWSGPLSWGLWTRAPERPPPSGYLTLGKRCHLSAAPVKPRWSQRLPLALLWARPSSGPLPARPCPRAVRLPAGRCRLDGNLGGRGASEARSDGSPSSPRPVLPGERGWAVSGVPGPLSRGGEGARTSPGEPAGVEGGVQQPRSGLQRANGGGNTAGGCVRLRTRTGYSPPVVDALPLPYFLKIYLFKRPACL